MAVTVSGTPASYALPSAGESSSSFSLTVPSGATKLIVGAANVRYNPARQVTGITWNGSEALTSRIVADVIAAGASYVRSEIWTLDNPTAGTFNVVVTWNAAARGAVVALCVTGDAAGAPGATAGSTTSDALNASVAVATTVGGLTVCVYGCEKGDATTIALSAGVDQLNLIGSAGAGDPSTRTGMGTQGGTGGSVTSTYTRTGTAAYGAHAVISLNAAGGLSIPYYYHYYKREVLAA